MCQVCIDILTRIETDINVPLIVRGPGIGKNQTLDAITSHTDLAPTFLNIAGTTRDGLDGKKIPTTIAASTADNRTEHVAIEYWGLVSNSHNRNIGKQPANVEYRLYQKESTGMPATSSTNHITAIRETPTRESDWLPMTIVYTMQYGAQMRKNSSI